METEKPQINQLIKKYRLINQVRQEDMAKTIGVSRATLINYEKGHTSIPMEVLEILKKKYTDFESFTNVKNNNKKQPIIKDGIIDFALVLKIIFVHNRIKLVSIMFLFAIIGVFMSYTFTNYYSSGISLFPAKNKISSLNQLQSIAMTAGVNLEQNDQNYNITDVAKSRRIAEKVLLNNWKTIDGDNKTLIEFWNLNEKSFISRVLRKSFSNGDLLNAGLKKYFKLLKVNEDRRTGLINVSIEMESPSLAAEVANFIGTQIQIYIQKQNTAKAVKEKLFINDRLIIVKNELEVLEDNLKEFKERNRGYEVSPELFMIFTQKFREAEAKQQVYVTLQQQLELARINEVRQTPIINILDEAKAPINKSRPNRTLILILSIFSGFLVGASISIIKY